MFKASIELGKINKSLKLKFGLIIESESDKKAYQKIISKFNYNGNDYLRINPRPYISIDISSKNDEAWSTNQSFTLTKPSLFIFKKQLSTMISEYKSYSDLFYYKNDTLIYDQKYTQIVSKDIISANNKHVKLVPCVVYDEEIENKAYEGCALFINSRDNFVYITYTEMEYLLENLSNINMDELSIQLINSVLLMRNIENENLTSQKVITESDNMINNKLESTTFTKIDQNPTIPEI